MAATHSPSFEGQDLRSYARGMRDRLRSLWGKSRKADSEPSQSDSSPLEYSAGFPSRSALNITAYDDFRIETRGTSEGWRVATVDESNGNRHEFYVQGGVIYRVDPWSESTRFVVGRPVERISDSERQAILHAVRFCEHDTLPT
jgi:hypothetical protein